MGMQQLVAYALPHDGVFTWDEARYLGVGRWTLLGMIARGEVARLYEQVLHFCVVPLTEQGRLRAAMKAAGGLAVVSHSSAARQLKIPGAPSGRPELTMRGSIAPAIDGARVHRSRSLPDEDVISVRGMSTTTGPRTLIDLAARQSVNDRLDLLDRAICARVASRAVVCARAEALSNGRHGVRTLYEATRPGADGEFWSRLERTFGGGIRVTNLQMPEFNVPLRYRGRRIVVDALWRREALVAELRGLQFHSTPEHRLRDDERQNIATQMQLRCLVFGWRQVMEAFDEVADQIGRALG